MAIARFDDSGAYRPLKTAPNLRHGWRLELATLGAVGRPSIIFIPDDWPPLPASNRRSLRQLRCAKPSNAKQECIEWPQISPTPR